MVLRLYNKEQDRDNIMRVWRETGWLHSGCEDMVDCIMEAGRSWVADIDGAAEAEEIPGPERKKLVEGFLARYSQI